MISVLYVDDEPALLEICKIFLEKDGEFRVDTVGSARDALTYIQTIAYDAIVSDYQMPDMDGIEFLRAVRASGNTTPFIIFTGRGREEVVIQALNEGADFYLHKGGEPRSQFAELSNKIRYAVTRKQAEESVRQNEAQLRQIIDLVPHLIFAKDWDGNYILANQKVAELYQTSVAELVGKPQELFHKDLPQLRHMLDDDREVMTRGTSKLLPEEPFIGADGTLRVLQTTKVPFITPGRFRRAVLGVAIDITDQKRAGEDLLRKNEELNASYEQIAAVEEELRSNLEDLTRQGDALRESEEKFRGIFGMINDAIHIHDVGPGGKPGKFIEVNEVACRMMQYTRDEMLNLGPFDLVTGYHSRPLDEILGELASTGQSFFETEHRRKDGIIIPVEINTRVVDLLGKKVVVSVVRDITERKRAEEELRRKSEELNASYEQITATEEELRANYEKLIRQETELNVSYEQITATEEELRANYEELSLQEAERKQQEAAFRAIVRAMVGSNGPDAFLRITESVSSWLGADIVTVGELSPDGQALHVLTTFSDGKHYSDRSYPLQGTPYGYVAEHGYAVFPDDVAQTFPACSSLTGLGIRGFAGTPLLDHTGTVIGILCIFTRNLFIELPGMKEIIDVIAVKAAAEIERKNTEEALLRRNEELNASYEQMTAVEEELRANIEDLVLQENALRAGEERLSAILNIAQVGIVLIDAESHRILKANAMALSLIGATSGEVTGAICHQFICPAGEGSCPITDLGMEVNSSERVLIRTDGTRIPILKSVTTTEISGRKVLIESFIDISAQKRVEAALRESEAWHRDLVTTTSDILWQTNDKAEFIFISPQVEKIVGYTPDELIGRRPAEFMEPASAATTWESFQKGTENPNAIVSADSVWYHKDGHRVILENRAVPIFHPDGSIAGFRGIDRDITKRRLAEESLEKANHKLNLLAGITRHDISNQLTALQGYLALLEEELADPGNRNYRNAETAADRISAINRFANEYEQIGSTAPVWQDARSLVGTEAQQVTTGNVAVLNDIPPGTELFADPLIPRVFYNLMDNAVRHGGKITKIRFFVRNTGGSFTIVCEDDGDGVNASEKERIFERGFGKNTGLGLALSKETLSITGITIRETGEPGTGARFEMNVPEGAYRLAGTGKP